MRRRAAFRATTCLAFVASAASADGGAPVATARRDAATYTLLVSPASPTVGPVEFTLLGPSQPAARLRLIEAQDLAQELSFAQGTLAAGGTARTTLDTPGTCRFEVMLDGERQPLLAGELPVQPAPPDWLARWPWLFAWVPVAVLLALRARAERDLQVPYTRARTR